jgi:hypothetical protein
VCVRKRSIEHRHVEREAIKSLERERKLIMDLISIYLNRPFQYFLSRSERERERGFNKLK